MTEFLLILCLAGTKCIESGSVVQVAMPPSIVHIMHAPEQYPRAWIDGKLYILVPEVGA